MFPRVEYTRHDLAQAVLDAHPDSKRGLDMFRGGFSDDMKAHQVRMRDTLLTAFGIAILMCFVVGQSVAAHELRRRGHDAEPLNDMVFAAVIFVVAAYILYQSARQAGAHQSILDPQVVFGGAHARS